MGRTTKRPCLAYCSTRAGVLTVTRSARAQASSNQRQFWAGSFKGVEALTGCAALGQVAEVVVGLNHDGCALAADHVRHLDGGLT